MALRTPARVLSAASWPRWHPAQGCSDPVAVGLPPCGSGAAALRPSPATLHRMRTRCLPRGTLGGHPPPCGGDPPPCDRAPATRAGQRPPGAVRRSPGARGLPPCSVDPGFYSRSCLVALAPVGRRGAAALPPALLTRGAPAPALIAVSASFAARASTTPCSRRLLLERLSDVLVESLVFSSCLVAPAPVGMYTGRYASGRRPVRARVFLRILESRCWSSHSRNVRQGKSAQACERMAVLVRRARVCDILEAWDTAIWGAQASSATGRAAQT